MNCFRLRSYDITVQGGFTYEQTVGVYRKFGPEPLIDAVANQVYDFRRANNLPRATLRESLEDVDHYNCAKIGNNQNFCVPCDGQAQVAVNWTSPMVAKPCGGCGAPVT